MLNHRCTLLLVRGLPGSGKSTFVHSIAPLDFAWEEADHYMIDDDGNYKFEPNKLEYAHQCCQENTRNHLLSGTSVAVANTSTTEKEVEIYKKIAEEAGANFVSLIVENRNNTESIHGVPDHTLVAMRKRFSVKL
mgnify:FL=1